MKVAVITVHHVINYGAILQAYALCRTIESLGHEAVLIDYHGPATTMAWKGHGLRSMTFLSVARRKCATRKFIRRHLPLTEQVYHSDEELIRRGFSADAFVCGSDQIWNTPLLGFDPAFFLHFAPEGKRKIAYAPSFGSHLPDEAEAPMIRDLLSGFQHLSVREQEGADYLARLLNRPVTRVVDPTLLDADFSECLAPAGIKGEFLFSYHVHSGEAYAIHVRRLADQLGLPLVSASSGIGAALPVADVHANDTDPAKWLGYIRDAAFVCTDSFHGSIFSVKFKKKFLAFAPIHAPNRLKEYLTLTGLSDRFISPNLNETYLAGLLKQEINYDAVESRMRPCIDASLAYLKQALA